MSTGSQFKVRVYYEDTDFSGNVYHAAYIKFFERARTEFLRERGVYHSVLARGGIGFVVRRMSVSYNYPAHIDDLLEVETEMKRARGARLELIQTIARAGDVLVNAEVTVAVVGANGRPMRLPPELSSQF